jgi:hypothetical protein
MSFIKNTINTLVTPEISVQIPTVSFDDDYDDYDELYNKLDTETREQVDKYTDKKIKHNLLRDISNPKLKATYNKLNNKTKKTVDSFGIRDKYVYLNQRLEKEEKEEKEKKEKKENVKDIKEKEKELTEKEKKVTEKEKELTEKEKKVTEKEKKVKEKEKTVSKKIIIESSSSPSPSPRTIPCPIPTQKPPSPEEPPPSWNKMNSDNKELPSDLLNEEDDYDDDMKDTAAVIKTEQPTEVSKKINKIVEQFYSSVIDASKKTYTPELEVRFGTLGIKKINRSDYDNVIKKLKSVGFKEIDINGAYLLRINSEYLDNYTGKVRLSDIRTEINGLNNIQSYCKNNDIKNIYTNNYSCLNFIKKKKITDDKNNKIFPVNVNDFNFRVSYVNEENISYSLQKFIIENWKKNKKTFRYLNRITFQHDKYPFNVDISIVKYGNKNNENNIMPVYDIDDSNVFNNPEIYEIEIEADNKRMGPGTPFNNTQIVVTLLRKVIKLVLCGLQGTNYPIPYSEQKNVLNDYMKMIWEEEYNPKKYIKNNNFIGPNSKTLQLSNISPIHESSLIVNVRKSFVVTEKADGVRHLMYINNVGNIYLINTNMNVIFTGAKTLNKENYECLLDGELIYHDKNGNYINLYMAFDIYYYNNKDVRAFTFMQQEKETDKKSRYQLLKLVTGSMNCVSIIESNIKEELITKFKNTNKLLAPIRISSKEFYPYSNRESIFNGCNEILNKIDENRFEYNTDGLIFTHASFGVGSDKIGVSGPKTKITWDYSFKWKPPQYNTIDFLVTTIKSINNEDIIKPIFEDGINTMLITQLNEYKTIELRCGFNEYRDGYINPCQYIIDDNLPEYKSNQETNDIYPMRFYPTDPYDVNAGIAKIMLKVDESGIKQMITEENEVFLDNTIVEFSYDLTREEGWRWVPLRVRHDKTREYRQGNKQYGNAYETCNSNWKSIHYPITEDIIRTGMNIPDVLVNKDVYYNTPSGKFMTEALKNFHNLYVKKILIKNVSKPGDNLIDFACGKAGDLPKWIASKLSFVFGIDISKDNLENRLDGACTRYLNAKKENKNMPYALFVNGNSAYNIKNGSGILNDKALHITKAVFGYGSKDPNTIGKGVARQYGVGELGFNISSCQFALHYFLGNPDTLQGFLRNVAECTKLNGYFIGTAYDGKKIFDLLKKVKTGESVEIKKDDKKIWEVVKQYGSDTFDDDASSIGYEINVFQESINQYISEYLINFDYLNRVFEMYGFKIIDNTEAKDYNLPSGTGMFNELFNNMIEEIKMNKYKSKDYKESENMSPEEKKISFLNRYFVYKKIREVNIEKIQLELSEYNESNISKNELDTKQAKDVSIEVNKQIKPKVRKLNNKLLLSSATEAVEEPKQTEEVLPTKPTEEASKPKKIRKSSVKKTKLLINDE